MNVEIRHALRADLETCLQMDGSCVSDHVWQISRRESQGQIVLTVSEVRLPRPVTVPYPRTPEDIIEIWRSVDALLVAEAGGQLCGYLDLRAEGWHSTARITNFVVSNGYRQQGVGTRLLGAALQWARTRRLQYLMAEAPAQSWPAISFYRKLGLEFCGFHDRYYSTQVALFFIRRIS